MNNFWKKLTALLLALAMVCGCALAEETTEETTEEEEMEFSSFSDDYSVEVVYAWPDNLDGIPVFEAESYESWIATDSVEVFLPVGADAGFADYAKTLTDLGASLYVENELMTVLALGDTEIHLLPDEESPSIAFLGEPAYDYEEDIELYPELEEYVMPDAGRIVALEGSYDYGYDSEETEETFESIIVIVRCASVSDAIDYCEKLTLAGWVAQDNVKPEGNTLFGTYVRAGRMIMVDYYANSSDYMIYFGLYE